MNWCDSIAHLSNFQNQIVAINSKFFHTFDLFSLLRHCQFIFPANCIEKMAVLKRGWGWHYLKLNAFMTALVTLPIENKFTRTHARFTIGKKLCLLLTDFSADARSEKRKITLVHRVLMYIPEFYALVATFPSYIRGHLFFIT